jgi:hypothetical protein
LIRRPHRQHRLSVGYVAILTARLAVRRWPTQPRGERPAATFTWLAGNALGQGAAIAAVLEDLVAKDGIEPPTQGFSILCSTD